jgi:ABC-type amino acid transport system permease subunit
MDAGWFDAPTSKNPLEATAVTVAVYGASVLRSLALPNWSAMERVIVPVATSAQFPVLGAEGVAKAVI